MTRRMTLIMATLAILSLSVPADASVLQTVDVSTGINVGLFGNPFFPTTPGSRDDFWMVRATPAGAQAPNTRAWIVTMGNGWNSTAGTLPIFGNTNGVGTTEYERCFCLASTEMATLALTMRADNKANLYLNNYSGSAVVQALVNNTFASNVQPVQFTYTAQNGLKVGKNCLRVRVNNEGGPTGFSLKAILQGFGAQDTAQEPCCRPGQAVFTKSPKDLTADFGPTLEAVPARGLEAPGRRP